MKNDKPKQADVTARLNALVDDLADLAADLDAQGQLRPQLPSGAAGSTPARARRSRATKATPSAATSSAARAASMNRAEAIASTAEPERTRLYVLISAWWTRGQMSNTGLSFEDFIAAAVSNEPRAKPLWDDLTERLHKLTVAGLEQWPEAVLAPEVREFIEALVTQEWM